MPRKLKGQEMVFELVLIFSISLVIIIILYSIFGGYDTYYSSVGIGDSLSKVKSLVELGIIEMASGESNGSIILKIPERVLNEVYLVELSSNGLNISAKGISRSTGLTGIAERYSLFGKVPSINGRITIYKSGNQIIIQ